MKRIALVIGALTWFVAGAGIALAQEDRNEIATASRAYARPSPWRRMNGPTLWRSGTEYWRALSSDQP